MKSLNKDSELWSRLTPEMFEKKGEYAALDLGCISCCLVVCCVYVTDV